MYSLSGTLLFLTESIDDETMHLGFVYKFVFFGLNGGLTLLNKYKFNRLYAWDIARRSHLCQIISNFPLSTSRACEFEKRHSVALFTKT